MVSRARAGGELVSPRRALALAGLVALAIGAATLYALAKLAELEQRIEREARW